MPPCPLSITMEPMHAEMTNREMLDELLSVALDLIEAGNEQGDRLWLIHNCLEERLPPWDYDGTIVRTVRLLEQTGTAFGDGEADDLHAHQPGGPGAEEAAEGVPEEPEGSNSQGPARCLVGVNRGTVNVFVGCSGMETRTQREDEP